MPEEVYGLSDNDRDLLQRALDLLHNLPLNMGGNSPPPFQEQEYAPDTYVALVPGGGIPALTTTGTSGTVPGSAECEIYALINGSLTDAGFTEIVYNVTTSAISAGQYQLINRDKFGNWYAEPTAGTAAYGLNTSGFTSGVLANTGTAKASVLGVATSVGFASAGATLGSSGPGTAPLAFSGGSLVNNDTGLLRLEGFITLTFTAPLAAGSWVGALWGVSTGTGTFPGSPGRGITVVDQTGGGLALIEIGPSFISAGSIGNAIYMNLIASFNWTLTAAQIFATRLN